MSEREPHEVASAAVSALRDGAAALQGVLNARGDHEGVLADLIRRQREAAAALDPIARRLKPSSALIAWSRGAHEAMKNWHPTPPHEDRAVLKPKAEGKVDDA